MLIFWALQTPIQLKRYAGDIVRGALGVMVALVLTLYLHSSMRVLTSDDYRTFSAEMSEARECLSETGMADTDCIDLINTPQLTTDLLEKLRARNASFLR